jgi:dienelactone hydrolase
MPASMLPKHAARAPNTHERGGSSSLSALLVPRNACRTRPLVKTFRESRIHVPFSPVMSVQVIRKFLRALGLVILFLVVAWGGTGLYYRHIGSGPWPERTPVAPTGVFTKEVNCFHGGGYDEWIADLRGLNGYWNPLGWLLASRMPREIYEKAVATVDCRFVRYQSDGFEISGTMLAPKSSDGKRLPVMIYNRGGNGSFGAGTFFSALYALTPYAQEGFLVLASDYRGFTDSEPEKYGFDEFGGSDVRDVEKLIEFVDRLPQADPDNIFMLGASRGAMMSYLVARNSNRLRALASINGGADLEHELIYRPAMERVYAGRIPDYATRKTEVLAARSVLRWAEELPRDLPILLISGGRDERVDPQSSPRLKARLDELEHPSKLIVYPEDDHSLRQNRRVAEKEVIAWFRAHLKPDATSIVPTDSPAPVPAPD